VANMFGNLTRGETWVLSSKLISGAITSDEVLGGDQHDLTMELYDVVGDVQATWKTDDGQ